MGNCENSNGGIFSLETSNEFKHVLLKFPLKKKTGFFLSRVFLSPDLFFNTLSIETILSVTLQLYSSVTTSFEPDTLANDNIIKRTARTPIYLLIIDKRIIPNTRTILPSGLNLRHLIPEQVKSGKVLYNAIKNNTRDTIKI